MTSVNPQNSVQTVLHNLLKQLDNQVQSNKPGQPDANVTQRFGLPEGLVQNLRHDLNAVFDGRNPEKAVDNLVKDLQKLHGFVSPEYAGHNATAKDWPTGIEPPRHGVTIPDLQGKGGVATEWPTGTEPPKNAVKLSDLQGEGGAAKEWPAGKELPKNAVKLSDLQSNSRTAEQRPAGLEPSRDGIDFVMGKNGQPEQVKMAKERPADLGPARDGISFVKGKNGQPEQVSSTETKHLESKAPGSVEAMSDNVVATLKKFLEVSATGGNADQALKAVRGAVQTLIDSGVLANNPEQARDALTKSIREQA